RPLQPDDQRNVQADLPRRRHHAFGDDVAAHDAPEDVDQDRLDVRVGEDDLECLDDAVGGRAAADVEEVRRLAAVELDDVHRRHGEAGAVHHAADVTVELDVVEAEASRLQLYRVLLALVAERLDVLVPEQGVLVEIHLGIERQELAVAGDHERIDLDQAGVEAGEGLVDAAQELDRGADLLALEAQPECEATRVERLQARHRIDRDGEDLFGRLCRDLFDLDAALGRGHQRDAAGRPVHQHAEVQLACDVAPLLDIDAADLLPLGTGLVRDEVHADHRLGSLAHLFDRFDHLDAAALAASACVDLRLDDPDRPVELFRLLHGLFGSVGDAAARHRHPELGEQGLALILVNVHGMPTPPA